MRAPLLALAVGLLFTQEAAAQSDTTRKLDTMRVVADAPRALTLRNTFDDRRLRGFGHFYDSTSLRQRAIAHASDLLQGEQGITVVRPPMCTPRGSSRDPNVHHNNCVTQVSTRIAVTRGFCAVKLMLDGNTLSIGGEIDTRDERYDPRHNWTTAYDINSLDLGSVEKVEVYRRPEEIPQELKSFDTECGLVVLWTRR